MGLKSFTHMDEIRRRRILARAAARAEAGGTLPHGAIDFAWLLFGDPGISKVVDGYIDLSAVAEFERDIEAVKATLAQACGRLLKAEASLFPAQGEADVRKQFAGYGKDSQKREISRRIPAHMEYLRQRVIYVAFNRLLMEHYSTEDMTPRSTLASNDWAAHRDATREQIAAVEKALAEAAGKKGTPPSAASILVKKPHKARGRPRGTSSSISSASKQDIATAAEMAETAVEQVDSGETDTVIATSVATSHADAAAAEDLQPIVQDADEQPAISRRSDVSLDPAGKPAAPSLLDGSTQETVDFRVKDILVKNKISGKLTQDEKEIARLYQDIELTPIDMLDYYVRDMPNNLLRKSSFRFVDFMRKFGDYNVSCDYDGFLGKEPQEGFYKRFELHRRTLHKRGARYFEKHGPDLMPDLFKAKMPEGLARGIGLFGYFRKISGGTAFDANATPILDAAEVRDIDPSIKRPPTNWWEFIYGYNAYTQYNFHMARLLLKGLSLVDVHLEAERTSNTLKASAEILPPAILAKKGCFYEEISGESWKETFSQKYIDFKIKQIKDEYIEFHHSDGRAFFDDRNHTFLDNEEAAYADARSQWQGDIEAPSMRKDWRPAIFV